MAAYNKGDHLLPVVTLFANIKNLMGKMGWSAEQSMDVLSVSDCDRKALWQLLK